MMEKGIDRRKKYFYGRLINFYVFLNKYFGKYKIFNKFAQFISNLKIISNLRIMQGRPKIKINNGDLQKMINSKNKLLILSGNNNSGKSFALKELHKILGYKSGYLACQRFFTNDRLNPNNQDESYQRQQYFNHISSINNSNYNNDQNFIEFNSLMIGLKDEGRKKLFQLMDSLIGEKFEIKNFEEGNELSGKYVDVNGYNLGWTSTGTRLLMIILGTLLTKDYHYVLLDEPEIGLSPKVQAAIANLIFNDEARDKNFPHIKKIFITTHSHIFLNKNGINTNYIVEKKADVIYLKEIESFQELHHLQFNLLGNTFESLFLPSLFILTEGKTDEKFLKKVLITKFKNCNFVVINCCNDDQVRKNAELLKSLVGEFQTSPYNGRIFAIFDSVRMPNVEGLLLKKGFKSENIILWNKNGIEYYYPETILRSIYKYKGKDNISNLLDLSKEFIDVNGLSYTKNELADKVIELINESTEFSEEFKTKFLSKFENLI